MDPWYMISEDQKIPTPALLVYPDRIRANIREMIGIAGDVNRLRPHIKTHKCREIIGMQQEVGINKFKCATIAEAELLGACGAKDVLLAYQPIGPNMSRLAALIQQYPQTQFSALVDDAQVAGMLDYQAGRAELTFRLYIDLDVGMHRTGVTAGPAAIELLRQIQDLPHLKFCGWHVYDGHLRQTDLKERTEAAAAGFTEVETLINQHHVREVIVGGSPTFPIHALRPGVYLSPGTCLLWDWGYREKLPDLNFLPAAALLSRVVSKPGDDLICLDLGHKALASEMPHPRVHLPAVEVMEFTTHSEEHLVLRTLQAREFQVGDVLYGIPMHICPTAALHQEMVVVKAGKVVDRWQVAARDRRLRV